MTLDDAVVDVGIAFDQVEFSIKLLSYCELDQIRPAEFDTNQVVLLERENLAFPTGRFSTQEDIVRAAMVAVSLALAGSALTLDRAWEVAGIRPDPGSPERAVKLRTLVHMVNARLSPRLTRHSESRTTPTALNSLTLVLNGLDYSLVSRHSAG